MAGHCARRLLCHIALHWLTELMMLMAAIAAKGNFSKEYGQQLAVKLPLNSVLSVGILRFTSQHKSTKRCMVLCTDKCRSV